MRLSEGNPFKTCANPQAHNVFLSRANRYENKMVYTYRDLNCSGASPTIARDTAILSLQYPTSHDTFSGRLALYRAIIVRYPPPKKKQTRKSFAILSLHVSRMKSIATGPLSTKVNRDLGWNISVSVYGSEPFQERLFTVTSCGRSSLMGSLAKGFLQKFCGKFAEIC